ncbi:acyl-CoA dehydrogenase family protein [Neobacillus rhizophilus]|uniref:Acyl-CoA dehydrogenase n=1 Tax=Neobacillus rhizophilus TaxID=2833579 RepID=A0A942U3B6_9BACI|nr:acyl-CoA dehydrogenase family protein [Neobacillus rhizophilus]MBS4213891.1 acyl-CoA dehydrogenase [Neobacillus rhizophilus]MBU8917705.1 acyl-CoA dehydrogenase [Bacillus sp. FJAT-29953]
MANNTLEKTELIKQLTDGAVKVGRLAEMEAQEAEKNASISDNVVNLLKETQITRMLLPNKYGGPQVDLRTFAKVIRTVSFYNVSAGWLTYLFPLHNTLPSFLPPKTRDEVVNQGGLICDVFAPVGKAEKDGEGFRISGTYNFASGVLFSDWVGLGVIMEHPDSGRPEFCMPIIPISEVTVVKNWDTFGLRGTGSNQVIADNVYVPLDRILRLEVMDSTRRPPEKDYDKEYPFYHVPFFSAFYIGFANIALGGAERALAEFKQLTEKRVRLMDGTRESESPRSQRVIAEATTEFHAVEALMEKYIHMLENYENEDEPTPGPAEFFAIRTKIIKSCVDIVVRLLLTLGGAALYKGGPIELILRDLISVATHKTSLYEDAVASYGKELFGFNGETLG